MSIALSIITPTIGRDSLSRMLDGLLPQLKAGDQVIVIGDGPQPNARKITQSYRSPYVSYFEHGPILNYGNPQRNLAIKMAKGDYLMFVDDDDQTLPDAVKGVKEIVAQSQGRPFMFRMYHGQNIIWTDTEIRGGNVSGQMFIPPNIKERLGVWSGRYSADFDFITSTMAKYPEGPAALVWRPELVAIQGFAGPSKNAVEL